MAEHSESANIESTEHSMHPDESVDDRIIYENQLSLNTSQVVANDRPTEIPAAKVSEELGTRVTEPM